jgi:hypothetical protein
MAQGGGKPTNVVPKRVGKKRDLDDYYASRTALSCGQVGQEIKNCFKRKLRTSPTILGGWLGQSLTQGVGN